MTPEAQNIAIAKAIGRKFHHPTEEELRSGSYYQYEPDFTHDLNACAEMEKVLESDKVKFDAYAHRICMMPIIVEGESTTLFDEWGWYGLLRATAAQRAEAFLRTLGLWKE